MMLILYLYSAGVIDGDYRGNVGVVLFNLSKEQYQVKKGDRIAQLVLERIFMPAVQAVEVSVTGPLNTYLSFPAKGATFTHASLEQAVPPGCSTGCLLYAVSLNFPEYFVGKQESNTVPLWYRKLYCLVAIFILKWQPLGRVYWDGACPPPPPQASPVLVPEYAGSRG